MIVPNSHDPHDAGDAGQQAAQRERDEHDQPRAGCPRIAAASGLLPDGVDLPPEPRPAQDDRPDDDGDDHEDDEDRDAEDRVAGGVGEAGRQAGERHLVAPAMR